MIATAKKKSGHRLPTVPAWHEDFLAMLPQIRRQARFAFRHCRPDVRRELVDEVVANALVAFVRLVELGKQDLAYPTVLAQYGIKQVRSGRRVGCRLNVNDVLSGYAQQRKQFRVRRLDHFDRHEGQWKEAVVEDRRTPVADQAAFRVDFPRWLATHSPRNRRIAEALATGYSTGEVAREFGVSAGRISQLRRKLHESWQEFHERRPADTSRAACCGGERCACCPFRSAG